MVNQRCKYACIPLSDELASRRRCHGVVNPCCSENNNSGSMDISSPIHTIADLRLTMNQGSGSRPIHHNGDEGHHDTYQGREYAYSGGLRNLDEVAAPPPI